ncbi:bifunctional 4-hydroxy-2-oxoglutarate aldolase/2-dehydro-3-deoxy-phosphogluconate aldolase [Candidatus Bathyarchaeota archaeon]|nr:bifunctional 4-hydroxy-2-oxoglutarate aldolase/2-dehydro-3-deoxy-phosphogluconate aldolase [Candidatus Bathyarchaeota archaeon]
MKPFEQDLKRIEEKGLIPVVIIEDPEKAVPLGKAFLKAGLDVIEITMRTQRAMEAIKVLREKLPEMLVGAGTVFSVQIAQEAIKTGARFIVSPHLDEEIVTYCVKNDIIVCPGIYTPTEVNRAIQAAVKAKEGKVTNVGDLPLLLKIFPATSGGPEHIKALKAVFPNARFIPLGGINAKNLADFIKAGAWAIGGTWICKKELINSGEMEKISELTAEALKIIKEARGSP